MPSKTSKKKTSRKSGSKVSKKQTKARSKFKKMIALAKKIRKMNPDKKWAMCIKEAAEQLKK